jgi:hypothetical protein
VKFTGFVLFLLLEIGWSAAAQLPKKERSSKKSCFEAYDDSNSFNSPSILFYNII